VVSCKEDVSSQPPPDGSLAHPAGGLGVKMADPSREVYVMVGDGSYLMMAQEIVTSLQENVKLNIVLLDNHGFSSIGGLSRACGSEGFGTEYRFRNKGMQGDVTGSRWTLLRTLPVWGAFTVWARTHEQLSEALDTMKKQSRTVVVVETDYQDRVPEYECWWDVPIAEVSEMGTVQQARRNYVEARKTERYFWPAKSEE